MSHTPETDLKLWYDLLGDFPFEDDSDKENAIGFRADIDRPSRIEGR